MDDTSFYTLRYDAISQVLQYANGLTWLNISSGSGFPAGSDQAIQFNKTGAFGADANLKFDYSDGLLLVGGLTFDAINNLVALTPITSTARDMLSPSEGSIIANLTTHTLEYYDGTQWNDLTMTPVS